MKIDRNRILMAICAITFVFYAIKDEMVKIRTEEQSHDPLLTRIEISYERFEHECGNFYLPMTRKVEDGNLKVVMRNADWVTCVKYKEAGLTKRLKSD